MIFQDRHAAGQQLAKELKDYKKAARTLVLGLPRGGVVVAYEVAKALQLPLDVVCPRKVGAPFNPELAIGAVTESGQGYFDPLLLQRLGISENYVRQAAEEEKQQALRRVRLFRKGLPPRQVNGQTVILIDDGLATGATMKAAVQSMKSEGAAKIVVAIPVAPEDTIAEMRDLVDEVRCLSIPPFFAAIGQFYDRFPQTEDEEVIALLSELRK